MSFGVSAEEFDVGGDDQVEGGVGREAGEHRFDEAMPGGQARFLVGVVEDGGRGLRKERRCDLPDAEAGFQFHRSGKRIGVGADQPLAQHAFGSLGSGEQDMVEDRDVAHEAARAVADAVRMVDQPGAPDAQAAQRRRRILHREDRVIAVQFGGIVAHHQILEHAQPLQPLKRDGERRPVQAAGFDRRHAVSGAYPLQVMRRFGIVMVVDHRPAGSARQFERDGRAMVALIGFGDIEEGDAHDPSPP